MTRVTYKWRSVLDLGLHPTALVSAAPDPRVSEPNRWQDVNGGCVRSSVADCQFDQNIIVRCFGIFHLHVKISIFFKNT